MYANDIRCSDCHDPHSLKLKYEGNQVCTSCHQHPAAKYDSPEHHHHLANSPGAQCVECHMPSVTYMEVDARRDHSLRVPRPDMSLMYGTPNACTGCHLNKDELPGEVRNQIHQFTDWFRLKESGDAAVEAQLSRVDQAMAEAYERWYGATIQARGEKSYYELLAAFLSQDAEDVSADEMKLVVNPDVPAMVRASAMGHLSFDHRRESLDIAKQSLSSPEGWVVSAALSRIESAILEFAESDEELVDLVSRLVGLLDHSNEIVRIDVARILGQLPKPLLERLTSREDREKFEQAMALWETSLRDNRDLPESQILKGQLALRAGRPEAAAEAFRMAIRIDPAMSGPRQMLIELQSATKNDLDLQLQNAGANIPKSQLQNLIARSEQLVQEIDRLAAEEHQLLAADVRRAAGLVGTQMVDYQYAMSCYRMGDMAGMEQSLLNALKKAPDDSTCLYAIAVMFLDQGAAERGLPFAKQLVELQPDRTEYAELLRLLQAAIDED
ncbi:MAG: tetratricopeptide repeat protein [Pirellulaceae bacterium]